MKKVILLLFSVCLFSACSQQPECNDDEAKELVLGIMKDYISEDVDEGTLQYLYSVLVQSSGIQYSDYNFKGVSKISQGEIAANKILLFKSGGFVLENVRVISKDDNLKKCTCKAELDFSEAENEKLETGLINIGLKGLVEANDQTVAVDYTLQTTEDGDLYAELRQNEDFMSTFITYSFFKKLIAKNTLLPNKVNYGKIYSYFAHFGGDCGYEIRFKIAPNHQVEGVYIQECAGDVGGFKTAFEGVFKNEQIKTTLNNRKFVFKFTVDKMQLVDENGNSDDFQLNSRDIESLNE